MQEINTDTNSYIKYIREVLEKSIQLISIGENERALNEINFLYNNLKKEMIKK